ncbi:hypothetical protein HDV05_001194, partial [Chytridiales sp. JEL 0842]
MDDLDISNILTQSLTLESSISQIESALDPLLNENLDALSARLEEPLDRAKLSVLVGYAINSLVFTYLRTMGATKGHPVRKELERIKEYMDKIARAAGAAKPSMRVDQAAAKRFVKSAIGGGGVETAMEIEQKAEKEADSFLESLSTSTLSPKGSTLKSTPANTAKDQQQQPKDNSSLKPQTKSTPKPSPKRPLSPSEPSSSSKQQPLPKKLKTTATEALSSAPNTPSSSAASSPASSTAGSPALSKSQIRKQKKAAAAARKKAAE